MLCTLLASKSPGKTFVSTGACHVNVCSKTIIDWCMPEAQCSTMHSADCCASYVRSKVAEEMDLEG